MKLPGLLQDFDPPAGYTQGPLMKGTEDEPFGAVHKEDPSPVEGKSVLGGPEGQEVPSGVPRSLCLIFCCTTVSWRRLVLIFGLLILSMFSGVSWAFRV